MFAELVPVDGQRNAGGLQDEIYIARASQVTGWPTKAAEAAAMDEVASVTGPVTFGGTDGFYKISCVQNSVGLNCPMIGELDGQSFRSVLSGMVAGGDAKTLGLLANLANTKVVALGRDKEGRLRLIGSAEFKAQLQTGEHGTGEQTDGRKGATFEIFYEDHIPAPIYADGTITEADASASSSAS